jgi:hypothetical protein
MLELLKEGRQKNYQGRGPTVKGSSDWELRRALNKLGYTTKYEAIEPKVTFAAWLRRRTPEQVRAMYLVSTGNHWVVVQGRKACCGIVKTPRFISKMRARRASVKETWMITRLPADRRPKPPKLKGLVRPRQFVDWERRVKALERKAWRDLHKLSRQHGFNFKVDKSDSYLELTPCAIFPKGFTTYHMDWIESYARVKLCIDDPSKMDPDGSGYSE